MIKYGTSLIKMSPDPQTFTYPITKGVTMWPLMCRDYYEKPRRYYVNWSFNGARRQMVLEAWSASAAKELAKATLPRKAQIHNVR